MNNVLSWVSLGLWVIYGLLLIYREILRNKKMKNNNIFHLIRFDSVLFLAIYLFYKYYAGNFRFFYLYIAIIITNIVYILYDIMDNYDRKNNKENILYYIIFLIAAIILGVLYIFNKDYLLITTITLIINIFIPLYVWLLKRIRINSRKSN